MVQYSQKHLAQVTAVDFESKCVTVQWYWNRNDILKSQIWASNQCNLASVANMTAYTWLISNTRDRFLHILADDVSWESTFPQETSPSRNTCKRQGLRDKQVINNISYVMHMSNKSILSTFIHPNNVFGSFAGVGIGLSMITSKTSRKTLQSCSEIPYCQLNQVLPLLPSTMLQVSLS